MFAKSGEKSSANKKVRLKNVVKTLIILAVFSISYTVSALTSSVYETNKKLVILLICFLIGFVLFYLIYGVLYLIALFSVSKKTQKLLKREISCDSQAADYFDKKEYRYKYDNAKTFNENMSVLKSDALSVVKDISDGYGNHDDKFYYLGYTVYDAMEVIDGAIDLIDSKITPVFKFLRAEDKPLKSVETALQKALKTDVEQSVSEETAPKGFFKKIGAKLVKTTAFVFRGKIENAVTDVVKFIGFKAFEVYGKSGKDYRSERDEVERND